MKKHTHLVINLSVIGEGGRNVCGGLSPEIIDIQNVDYLKCLNSVDYDLDISIVTDSALVTGKVSSLTNRHCDRCLKQCELVVENNNICHYIPLPEDKIIDLTDEIREDLLIVLPQRFVCSEDCRGLCSNCGENLNENMCKCSEDPQSENIWSKLNELKL